MEKTLDVSIIIVNFNTRDVIKNCLKSIFEKTKDIDFEVIVSDNGSTDGSIEMIKSEFPQVILIENNANLGFGAANNRGLKIAKGKYIFYLNSDTILLNNAVKIFFDYWENSPEKEKIGALGCGLQNENGKSIHSGGKFPSYKDEIIRLLRENISISVNSLFAFLHIKQLHKRKNYVSQLSVEKIDYVTGADLFLLNNDFAKFDERYFLYFEETDLQFKMSKSNLKRELVSEPKIVHLEGKSNKTRCESVLRYISFSSQQILISRLVYFKKNDYKFFPFLMVFILSVLYGKHVLFIRQTKKFKKQLCSIYCS